MKGHVNLVWHESPSTIWSFLWNLNYFPSFIMLDNLPRRHMEQHAKHFERSFFREQYLPNCVVFIDPELIEIAPLAKSFLRRLDIIFISAIVIGSFRLQIHLMVHCSMLPVVFWSTPWLAPICTDWPQRTLVERPCRSWKVVLLVWWLWILWAGTFVSLVY